jgi:hypothetical protein
MFSRTLSDQKPRSFFLVRGPAGLPVLEPLTAGFSDPRTGPIRSADAPIGSRIGPHVEAAADADNVKLSEAISLMSGIALANRTSVALVSGLAS